MFSDSRLISTGKLIVLIHLMPSESCFIAVMSLTPKMILNQKSSDCSLSLEDKPGHMFGFLLKWIDTDVVGCYRRCGTGFGDDSVGLSALKGFCCL